MRCVEGSSSRQLLQEEEGLQSRQDLVDQTVELHRTGRSDVQHVERLELELGGKQQRIGLRQVEPENLRAAWLRLRAAHHVDLPCVGVGVEDAARLRKRVGNRQAS